MRDKGTPRTSYKRAMHEDPMKETRPFTNGHHAPLEDNGRRQSGPAGGTAAVIGVIKLSRCRL
jgi:hypothetical protein